MKAFRGFLEAESLERDDRGDAERGPRPLLGVRRGPNPVRCLGEGVLVEDLRDESVGASGVHAPEDAEEGLRPSQSRAGGHEVRGDVELHGERAEVEEDVLLDVRRHRRVRVEVVAEPGVDLVGSADTTLDDVSHLGIHEALLRSSG